MRFRRVDIGIDVAGLKFFRVDHRNPQRPANKAGQCNPGALHREHFGDLLAPETLGQLIAHTLHQVHVHTVIEEHIHMDNVPLAYLGLLENTLL